MGVDLIWAALALVLVFEGILPLVAPRLWRRVFSEMLGLRDGQLRFFGVICVASGALMVWLLS
ncbi:DUF2065 domain-containing protein [Hydrogenophaga sp. PBL-H3]|nr:DUF2065 domain-containing protein [Hydrogenophaga sp. PBL-H3]QHE76374.1 DUF2065 domain-containing protein [Hydrogenophaga sp. PBL-H3]QHE80798.1 DUF2065 domain-containing protein [Hydrogenophaga sp. PBL-H3]